MRGGRVSDGEQPVYFQLGLRFSDFFVSSIKREIGHLCHDERRPKVADKPATSQADLARTFAPGMFFFCVHLFSKR